MPLVCLVNGQTTPKRIQPSAACSRAPTESCPPPTGTWPSTFAARSRSLRLRLHRPRVAALGQAHRAQGALHAATLLDLEAGGPALPFDGRLLLLGPVELLGEHLLVIPLGLQVLADGDGVFPHLVRQPEAAHLLVELAERLERPRLLRVAHVEAAHIRLPRLLQELERVLEVDLARLLALRRVALRLCHVDAQVAQRDERLRDKLLLGLAQVVALGQLPPDLEALRVELLRLVERLDLLLERAERVVRVGELWPQVVRLPQLERLLEQLLDRAVLRAVGVEDEARAPQPVAHLRHLAGKPAAHGRLARRALLGHLGGDVLLHQLARRRQDLDRLVARRLALLDDAEAPLHLAELGEVVRLGAHQLGVLHVLVRQLGVQHQLERLRGRRIVAGALVFARHLVEHLVRRVRDRESDRHLLEHVRRDAARHELRRRPHEQQEGHALQQPEVEEHVARQHRQHERLVHAL
mmetsp:Transcript_48425/g.143118  ORF Transcript_48425/g.143118 Transcript_48425/m.143118 type:complete len:467 (-) Transcript_48425:314-1714(-)